jgi:hypothetical protein
MKRCVICREVSSGTNDQLCSSCREAIIRLSIICKREPFLLCPQSKQTAATREAETLAIAA